MVGIYRTEKDVMGEIEVPADSYYGAFTQRAKINFQISGIKANKDIELATVADQLAQAKIEELTALDYNALTPGTLENQVHVESDPANPFYKFTRSSSVELVDSNFNASAVDIGLKKITATIYWPDVLGGNDHSAQLVHLKVKR